MELADVTDSKSVGGNTVRVRPPPPAPWQSQVLVSGACGFLFALVLIVLVTESVGNNLSRWDPRFVIEVTIKIGGNVKSRMSEPILNRFHGHAVRKQEACTAMTQIVETQRTELILLDYIFEMPCNVFGRDERSRVVPTYLLKSLS